MSRKPSYFDDDYDEKVNKKKKIDFKTIIQFILLYIVLGIKWIRDTAVTIYQKHSKKAEYKSPKPTEVKEDTSPKKRDYFSDILPPAPSISEADNSPDPEPEPEKDEEEVELIKEPTESVEAKHSRLDDEIEKIRKRANIEIEPPKINKSVAHKIMPFVLIFITIFGLVSIIGTFMYSFQRENKRINQFNADASAVCAEKIKDYGATNYENLYTNYKIEGYRMTGLSYVRELDFDNDGTSELLLCYNDNGIYYVEVYAYTGGKFQSIYHGKAAQTENKEDDAWITLYYRSNKYYIGEHDEGDISKVTLMAMHGDKFSKRSEVTYEAQDEAFIIRKKIDYTSFERIKLSVLREEKAFVILERVTNTIDQFQSNTVSTAILNDANNNNYKKAYREVVDKHIQDYGEPEYKEDGNLGYIDGLAIVKLVDFDNDDNDELVLVYRKLTKTRDEDSNGDYVSITNYTYYTEVYSFNGTTAQMVFQKEGVCEKPDESDDLALVIKNDSGKHDLCFNTFIYEDRGHVVNATSTILEYNDKSFEPIFKSKYTTDYGYSDYYIDDEWVSHSTFNEKGCEVPFFDGKSTYSSSQFDVTYVQKRASASSNIKGVVDDTNNTIKKLS